MNGNEIKLLETVGRRKKSRIEATRLEGKSINEKNLRGTINGIPVVLVWQNTQ